METGCPEREQNMYKTTKHARPEQDARPMYNPARVAGVMPFCYNVTRFPSGIPVASDETMRGDIPLHGWKHTKNM